MSDDKETVGTYRPPCYEMRNFSQESHWEGFDRRVCPNCRLYFDTEEGSATVFCSKACHRRHQRGEFL